MNWPREIEEWLKKKKATDELVEAHEKTLEDLWSKFEKALREFAEKHAGEPSPELQAYHDLLATEEGQKLLKKLFDEANDIKKYHEAVDEAGKDIDDATKKKVLEVEKFGAHDAVKADIIKAWREWALKKAQEESDAAWAEFKKIIDSKLATGESDEVMDQIKKSILELEHAKAEAEKHKPK